MSDQIGSQDILSQTSHENRWDILDIFYLKPHSLVRPGGHPVVETKPEVSFHCHICLVAEIHIKTDFE